MLELIVDERLDNIGCDTVILSNSTDNTLYISAHLKDYTPKNDKFIKQMETILSVILKNKDKKCILMMDANTQLKLEGNQIIAFSKDTKVKDTITFPLPEGIRVSGVISSVPTSKKMRAVHTAQLDKSLKSIEAVIDHVLMFNGGDLTQTNAYTLDESGNLNEIKDTNTMTTSPICIADHAFVISTASDGTSYGTLNIKGGDPEDKAWAEFLPNEYVSFFNREEVGIRLDELLVKAFNQDPKSIKVSGYVSSPRFAPFDINLPNTLVPFVEIEGQNILIKRGTEVCTLKWDGSRYDKEGSVSGLDEWIDVVLSELPEKQEFFISKGHKLLNYWYFVQNDDMLKGVYEEWYTKSNGKKTIGEMVRAAKTLHPSLTIVSLQELPKDLEKAEAVIQEIKSKNANCTIYHKELTKGCETKGAIIVFGAAGGKRRSLKRKQRKQRSRRRRRSAHKV